MDEELERFWRHHDKHPPVMGPPQDIDLWPGLKDFNGKPIGKERMP